MGVEGGEEEGRYDSLQPVLKALKITPALCKIRDIMEHVLSINHVTTCNQVGVVTTTYQTLLHSSQLLCYLPQEHTHTHTSYSHPTCT